MRFSVEVRREHRTQLRTQPTYRIAIISINDGGSEMIQRHLICFVHPIHRSGFDDVVCRMSLAVVRNETQGRSTTPLLSNNAQHLFSRRISCSVGGMFCMAGCAVTPLSSKMKKYSQFSWIAVGSLRSRRDKRT